MVQASPPPCGGTGGIRASSGPAGTLVASPTAASSSCWRLEKPFVRVALLRCSKRFECLFHLKVPFLRQRIFSLLSCLHGEQRLCLPRLCPTPRPPGCPALDLWSRPSSVHLCDTRLACDTLSNACQRSLRLRTRREPYGSGGVGHCLDTQRPAEVTPGPELRFYHEISPTRV